jgi:hypothetical protein
VDERVGCRRRLADRWLRRASSGWAQVSARWVPAGGSRPGPSAEARTARPTGAQDPSAGPDQCYIRGDVHSEAICFFFGYNKEILLLRCLRVLQGKRREGGRARERTTDEMPEADEGGGEGPSTRLAVTRSYLTVKL